MCSSDLAFGHLVRSTLKLQQALLLLEQAGGEAVLLDYPPRERPLLFGQKNKQWQQLRERYPGLNAREERGLPPGALQAQLKGGGAITLTQADFLGQRLQRWDDREAGIRETPVIV